MQQDHGPGAQVVRGQLWLGGAVPGEAAVSPCSPETPGKDPQTVQPTRYSGLQTIHLRCVQEKNQVKSFVQHSHYRLSQSRLDVSMCMLMYGQYRLS